MKTICFYFQVHQPFRLKRYRFFDIGRDHYYYDDFLNEDIIHRVADQSLVRANRTMLDMINESGGKFKVAFSISGLALDQMETDVPEVLDGFRALAKTGNVEFLAETYSHSLASLADPVEFENQVKAHAAKIELLFGQKPKVFRNTELIYNDDISEIIAAMGFQGMLVEGAKHVLGWKSPNYLYSSAVNPNLKLLLRNSKFSEDISTRFSHYEWTDYPLTADKFMNWIASTPESEQLINLFMNYEVLGNMQPAESGIFDFFKALPRFAAEKNIGFSTPSEVINKLKTVDVLSVPYPTSWLGEEKDVNGWIGNVLQKETFKKLYSISERVRLLPPEKRTLRQDWSYLQASDHFFYMTTKQSLKGFSPYDNPYDAFSNYMNVLADFIDRVYAVYPSSIENDELEPLVTMINSQSDTIRALEKEVEELKKSKKIMAKGKRSSEISLN